jgi:oligoribonuclease
MQRNDLLVWVDLEMTSLQDVLVDKITEIAVVLTDKDLNIVAEGPEIVIYTDPVLFERGSSGAQAGYDHNHLKDAVAASQITLEAAEAEVLAFLHEHVAPQSAPLCGNTIHTDRHFLKIQMRAVSDYLHYRCIDVSSVKELAKRWHPAIYEEAERRKGVKPHRAKADIINSINELRFYKETFFKID